jgi:hypothetical protein
MPGSSWFMLQPIGIIENSGAVGGIDVAVGSVQKPNGIVTDETAEPGIVVTSSVVVEVGFGIPLATCKSVPRSRRSSKRIPKEPYSHSHEVVAGRRRPPSDRGGDFI